MAQDLKKLSGRRKPVKSKSWRLLLVGELGNIISIRVSKPLILFTTTCLVALLAFASIATISYRGARLENDSLREELRSAETRLLAANKAREGAEVKLLFLESESKPGKAEKSAKAKIAKKAKPEKKVEPKKKIQPPPKKKEPSPEVKAPLVVAKAPKQPTATEPVSKDSKKSSTTTSESVKQKETPSPDVGQTPEAPKPGEIGESTDKEKPEPVLAEESLLVEKLELWQQVGESTVKFQFSLKNVGPGKEKIKGYTFVVLKPEEGSQETPRGSPWTPLNDGQPTIFKRGQYFSIARFKYVRGKIPQIQDVNRFKKATIFVYTETGDLFLEKVFEISDILRS